MDSNLTVFLFSLGTIVLSEMGDKSQLLVIAFASKYKAAKVLIGVFIATVLNQALAVAAGNFITRFECIQILIQVLASLSFIFFGLWNIREYKLEGEENRTTKFGVIVSLALAFFLAEMGDKTQLAVFSLSIKFPTSPIGILTGATTGMLVANGIGITVSVAMRRKIPERIIKLISAGIFILFGFFECYQLAFKKLNLKISIVIALLVVLALLTGVSAYCRIKSNREKRS